MSYQNLKNFKKKIKNKHETQIKARKVRNHSNDVVASKTSFKKYNQNSLNIVN